MKIDQRIQAVSLRKRGFAYSEIQERLCVSKGSLSRWLRGVSYRPRRETGIRRKLASVAAGQVLHRRKMDRIRAVMSAAAENISPPDHNVLHWLGIMAYWTEGSKTQDSQVVFTNTDPDLIRLVYRWWVQCCKVNPERIRLHIRVHKDVERETAERYWKDLTGIPDSQCYKTTIKMSGSSGRRVNKIRFGIATIKVCDTDLHYRIKGWIEGFRLQVAKPVPKI